MTDLVSYQPPVQAAPSKMSTAYVGDLKEVVPEKKTAARKQSRKKTSKEITGNVITKYKLRAQKYFPIRKSDGARRTDSNQSTRQASKKNNVVRKSKKSVVKANKAEDEEEVRKQEVKEANFQMARQKQRELGRQESQQQFVDMREKQRKEYLAGKARGNSQVQENGLVARFSRAN